MDETHEEKSSEPKVEPSPLKQIRTFQGDVAQVLEKQKESLFSIQAAEKLKMASGGTVIEEPADTNTSGRERALLLFVGGFVLIAIAMYGAWYTYKEFVRRSLPPSVMTQESRLITAESTAEINVSTISRENLFVAIADKSMGTNNSELRHLVLRKNVATSTATFSAQEFFQTLKSRAPGSLVRAFDKVFMLGTLGQNRFLIFKLDSFENAFAGMLAWEESMPSDIGPIFATAHLLKTIGPESVFKDVVYKNKDVRILYSNDTPVLLYTFFDNKMLVITDSFEALETLLDRLTIELLSR